MAQAIINHEVARRVLSDAIDAGKSEGYQPRHRKAREISDVMLGRHLTYRYILFTNLLAKATSDAANGLALQAGADLNGAFDSRSLCHKVVVDFDRDPNQLAGKLGRSNEPYLNKPARYTSLSTENAVRRGYDRGILEKCIDILGGLRTQADARQALEDAIHFVMQRQPLVAEAAELDGDASLHKALVEFARAALEQSCEGESCAIMTGLAFYLLGRGTGRDLEIKVHPTNQAGSSSNEVLDVDVYSGHHLVYTAEVKDKLFNANDVGHAAAKAAAAGFGSFYFVCGPRSQGAIRGSEFVGLEADQRNVRVSFVDIEQFFMTYLGLVPDDLNVPDVWAFTDRVMMNARVKDATLTHILSAARYAGLVN
ncbi:restriction endonuclease, SacI family [Neokomagataea anthophila]|uniref:Restriction endonuclease, SacI family n=1 Tax=Neokomagataea anthophila TaxID=2826925 RepID=A0ABS5E9Z9_9PROT|nr:restriction endonuclease, SacI family [Neokomagataea anthophila]